MLQVSLIALSVLALSLALAGLFIWRSRALLGTILGLLPVAVMELAFRWSIDACVRWCIDSACASAGLPAGCEIAEFGCTEGSGMAFFLFVAAGIADLALYLVGVAAISVIRSRRYPKAPGVPPTLGGPNATA